MLFAMTRNRAEVDGESGEQRKKGKKNDQIKEKAIVGMEQLKNKTIVLENKNTPFLFMALIKSTHKSISQILH